MSDLPIHIDHLGNERKLSLLPPTPRCMATRASAARIPNPIPRSEWTEVDYVTGAPSSLILDQKQYGQCVAASCVGANARQRWMRSGGDAVAIGSMAYLYDCINGHQDNGAVITDSQGIMLNQGVPDVSAYSPIPTFRDPGTPRGDRIYREDVAYLIDTPEDAATALIRLGGLPQVGILVTQSFEAYTRDGIAWNGRAPRGQANHSVYVAGLKSFNGFWCFRLVNSWTLRFGPFGDGTCFVPVDAIDQGGWLHLSNSDSWDEPIIPTNA